MSSAAARQLDCTPILHASEPSTTIPALLFHFFGHSQVILPHGVNRLGSTVQRTGKEERVENQHSVPFSLDSVTLENSTVTVPYCEAEAEDHMFGFLEENTHKRKWNPKITTAFYLNTLFKTADVISRLRSDQNNPRLEPRSHQGSPAPLFLRSILTWMMDDNETAEASCWENWLRSWLSAIL